MPNLLQNLNTRLKETASDVWNLSNETYQKDTPQWEKVATLPLRLGIEQIKGLKESLERSMYTGETSPEDALLLAMMGLEGSVPGGPVAEAGATSLGMIKGRNSLKGLVRSRMIEERKAWGPKVEEGVEGILDTVLRGTWWHGRHNYPVGARTETLRGVRTKELNLGEPLGVSLSAKPEQAKRFAGLSERERAAAEKLRLLYLDLEKRITSWPPTGEGTSIKTKLGQPKSINLRIEPRLSRVLPLLGGPPAEKILPAWKGPGTEGAQKILREAYLEALGKVEPENAMKAMASRTIMGQEVFAPLSPKSLVDRATGFEEGRKVFNQRLSDSLKARGYKGVLYSPERYGEYELKMFDPADVALVDWRRLGKLPERYKEPFDLFQSRFRAWEKAGPVGHEEASLARIWEGISEEEIRGVLERVAATEGRVTARKALEETGMTAQELIEEIKKLKGLNEGTAEKSFIQLKKFGLSNEDIFETLKGQGSE